MKVIVINKHTASNAARTIAPSVTCKPDQEMNDKEIDNHIIAGKDTFFI
ncbi:MAG: hypothetical protein ISR56_11065 [Bacteroidales bacterium]|nr:hypothetical protein [Bacteroidales bacterium]